jgi:hypothetical protein
MEVFMQRSWYLLDFRVQPFRHNRTGLIVLVLVPFLCALTMSLNQGSVIISQQLSALMFSSDAKALVSGSRDGTALVWNIAK